MLKLSVTIFLYSPFQLNIEYSHGLIHYARNLFLPNFLVLKHFLLGPPVSLFLYNKDEHQSQMN